MYRDFSTVVLKTTVEDASRIPDHNSVLDWRHLRRTSVEEAVHSPRLVRFGTFEVDLQSGELRKGRQKLKLTGQPFQVLAILLERPGEVVTREELQKRLWPDTFVDVDHNLNTAINKIREALADSTERPRFVETLPRRGYRFIGPVERAPATFGAHEGVQTSGSVPALSPPSSPSVRVAELRTPGGRMWKILVPTAALVAAAGIFVWQNRPLPPPKVLTTTRITRDGFPKSALLTDGSRLFITESSDPTKQFLVQGSVTGGDTAVVPTPFANPLISDVSPDHSQLLVTDSADLENDAQVWVLPLPTGSPRHLSDIVGHGAVWSPDGRHLAFSKGSDLFLANADGTNARKLTTLSTLANSIRFSPDGTRLRFTLWTPSTASASIWEIHVDGSDLHALLPAWHSPPVECCGVWSADGRYYFFVSGLYDSANIWALREPAGLFRKTLLKPLQLTSGPMSLFSPAPSPDGKKLFVEGHVVRGELVIYETKSHQFLPFLSGISAGDVDFSRDGKWIAFVSYPDSTLWRSRADGSERLQLTFPPVEAFVPHWSPDGTQIAYTDTQGGRPFKSFLISAQGGTPELMLSEEEYQVDAHWFPDGKRMIFGRTPWIPGSSENVALKILDLNSRRVSTVPGSENLYSPHLSPDGKRLAAYSSDGKRLLIFDFKTQKWTGWINEPEGISYLAWSRDGNYAYYTVAGKNPAYRRIKLGQTRSELVIDLKDLRRFEWSGLTPDGSALFVRDVSSNEIYSLDLELP